MVPSGGGDRMFLPGRPSPNGNATTWAVFPVQFRSGATRAHLVPPRIIGQKTLLDDIYPSSDGRPSRFRVVRRVDDLPGQTAWRRPQPFIPGWGHCFFPTSTGPNVSDADEFRKRAEECRQLAATVSNPLDRAFWLRLAEDWMNIAQESERAMKSSERTTKS